MRSASMLVVSVLMWVSGCRLLADGVPCVDASNCRSTDVCRDGVCVAGDAPRDAGVRPDGGAPRDAGAGVDGGVLLDAGMDGGAIDDAGTAGDAGRADGGTIDAGPDPLPPPLLLYQLEEGEGQTVADSAGVDPPIDLAIPTSDAVQWATGGLTISAPGALIASSAPATRVVDACRTANEVTLEAWVQAEGTAVAGPARIASLSQGATATHVSLNQSTTHWTARIETSTRPNNTYWSVDTNATVTPGVLTHLVMSHDVATGTRVFVNGVFDNHFAVGDDLSPWTEATPFSLANENPELNGTEVPRAWYGTIHRVALWCTHFTDDEVAALFAVGPG